MQRPCTMRIALQLHKADPKYAELEVALVHPV
jgi:hypothetical protein